MTWSSSRSTQRSRQKCCQSFQWAGAAAVVKATTPFWASFCAAPRSREKAFWSSGSQDVRSASVAI
jgi:hypothetical protein